MSETKRRCVQSKNRFGYPLPRPCADMAWSGREDWHAASDSGCIPTTCCHHDYLPEPEPATESEERAPLVFVPLTADEIEYIDELTVCGCSDAIRDDEKLDRELHSSGRCPNPVLDNIGADRLIEYYPKIVATLRQYTEVPPQMRGGKFSDPVPVREDPKQREINTREIAPPAPAAESERTEGRALTYLACPYSHPDANVRNARFEAANRAAGLLMRDGHLVFSPISHTHPIAVACELPLGWDFWQAFDRAYLAASRRLVVLCVDGWRESTGVTAEIDIADEMGIPVEFIEPARIPPAAEQSAEGDVLPAIVAELQRATTKFPTWPTDPLHALAVLGEEYGELTKAMLQHVYEPHKSTADDVRMEAMQTAAMSIRLALSLKAYEYVPCAQHEQPAYERNRAKGGE